MLTSHTVIDELAQTWRRLHGAAAEIHLQYMIDHMKRSGDATWEQIYRGILERVSACRGRANCASATTRPQIVHPEKLTRPKTDYPAGKK